MRSGQAAHRSTPPARPTPDADLGWNQELYQRLRLSLGLGLRRQAFLAVCDDLRLRDQLVGRLARELPAPQLTTLCLEPRQPWLTEAINALEATTAQLVGLEQLTRQAARLQRQFLSDLETLAQEWDDRDTSLLLWIPRPWLYVIRDGSPRFWGCCTGTFEFAGKPTLAASPLERPGRSGAIDPVTGKGPTASDRAWVAASSESLAARSSAQSPLDQWVTEAAAARTLAADPEATADTARQALETAVQCYRQAIAWAEAHPTAAAPRSLHYDLGGIYGELARWSDPAAAWEQAVGAYRAAIGDGSGADPAWRVAARNNLGTALWSWARHGDPIARLQGAIEVYREGLQDYASPAAANLREGDRLPPDALYGTLQANLGTAYLNLAQVDAQERWLLLAASAYEAALPYRSAHDRPTAYAATQNNLGTTYWQLGQRQQPLDPQRRRDCWQRAAIAYERALSIDPRIAVGFDRFAAASQLAWIHTQLATDAYGQLTAAEQAACLDRAFGAYLRLLDLCGDRPAQRDRALNGTVATIRALYQHVGLGAQSRALSKIPATWLPDVIDRLSR
ncbi:MAG: hypothetical protein EA001_10870 [Oscillatoriales cyanobacterium]|nr:MAG: hypothetical protein EA001_10870 [Oscillatoriales cyanobacterium]